MAEQNNNEFVLIRNIMIGVILLNLMFDLFILMGTSTSGINCSTTTGLAPQCQINIHENQITNSTTNLLNSFTCATNQTSSASCWFKYPVLGTTSTCWFSGCPLNTVAVALIFIANSVLGVVSFIINFVEVLWSIFAMVMFILLTLIPAIFGSANFGGFGTIFTIIYDSTVIIIIGYLAVLLADRWGAIAIPFG